MATIEQLRSVFGGESDAVTIQRAAQKTGIPIDDIASEVGFDMGGKWGNRFSASIDSAQGSLLGVGEVLTGSATLRNMREANTAEARAARQFARSQGAIMDSSQVDGVGSALEYVGGLAVDTAPQLAATGLAGLAAGPWGAGAVGYTFALGDILENQREQSGTTDLASAAALAVPYAAVDTFTGIGGAVTRRALPKAGLNLLNKGLDAAGGIKGAVLRTGVNTAKTALVEGAGETFQEGMNQLGRMAVDPNETFLNDRSMEAFKESFIGGAALGGAVGGVGGGWRRSEGYEPPKPSIDETGGVNLLNGQPLNPPPSVNPGAQRPLAEVINQRVGLDLGRAVPNPKAYPSAYEAAANEPSGVMGVDPATGHEYELTQAQYLEREAAQRNDAFAAQLQAEQAALAEDKAKIEAAQAVQTEAKDLGIKGKGISLYQQLKQALDDDIISEAEFREQRVQLGAKGNTDVARFLKGAYAASEARSVTQAAAAQEQAGLVESLKARAAEDDGTRAMEKEWAQLHAQQAGEVFDEAAWDRAYDERAEMEAAVQREMEAAAQAAPEVDLAPAEQAWESARERLRTLPDAVRSSIPAMPVFGDLTPEQKTQVADLAAKDQFTLAAADTVLNPPKKTASPAPRPKSEEEYEFRRSLGQRLLGLRKFGAPAKDKAMLEILQDWMGVDVDANGELTPREHTLSTAQIGAMLENSKSGKEGVTRQQVHKYIKATLEAIGAPKGTNVNKLRQMLGFQLSGTDLETINRNATTTTKPEDGTDSMDGAFEGAFDQFDPETGVEIEGGAPRSLEDDVGDGETEGYEVDLDDAIRQVREAERIQNAKTGLEKVLDEDLKSGAVLESDIAEAQFAFEGMGTRKKWENLSTYEQATAVRYYANARESGDPSVTENQREFNEANKPGNSAAQPDTGAGTDARQGVRGAGGKPQGEPRSAEAGNGGNAAAGKPVEEDQRPASQAPVVVVKKKRTIQKPVEAEVQVEPAPRFSKGDRNSKVTPTGTKTGNTVSQVRDAVNALFPQRVRDLAYQDRVKVHQTEADAVAAVGGKIGADEMVGAQGFVDPTDDRIIHLVADNLPKGRELGVLLHEVGVHVGLTKKFKGAFKVLADQVQSWADAPRGSLERRIYEAAKARVDSANPDAAERSEELVAYAAEEAASEGVMPDARGVDERVAKWLQNALSYMRNMVREFLGFQPAVTLTPQDLVDFAYGAARDTLGAAVVERAAMSGEPVTSEQLLDYYTKGKGYESDAAVYEDALPGTGVIRWGANSYYGPHVGKTTYAFVASAGADSRAGEVSGAPEADDLIPHGGTGIQSFGMAMTSQEAETEALIRNEDGEAALLTIQAWHTGDGVWEVGVFGPGRDTDLFKRLVDRGQAKLLPPDEDGHQWTALTGIGDGETRALLTEFRRRLTRALNGEVPHIIFTRATGAAIGKESDYAPATARRMFSKATPSVAQQLGPQYAKAETALTRAIGDLKTAAIKYGAFTRDLIDQAAKLMPAARTYLEHYEAVATDRTRMEQQVDAVLERFATLNTHERTRVNEVIRTSTMSREWAFKPDWLPNAKYNENSDVARAFRALTPVQRGVIQDVFRHGHDTLEAMQKAVKDNVNSEFDVLIKGFRDAGNMDEAAKAEARKAKALTEFSSMLEMNGNWPYAPLRRFGDHVVVAKSAAYRAAELADDKAQIKALEADENHYYVEFFESRGDARKKVADMQATGKYDQVENFNKGNASEQLYGGRDVFNAFRRLRGLVNETEGASLSEPANATINKLMNDLYLSLLGERSARQAERNRKNTAGADRDMMRAFATKGRADAHFIASLRFGGQVQEDLLQMKREADEGPNGGTRELRREYFNEILARHTMQMDFQSTPVVDKVMATSSFWQLLFNPAYYLQNVMQPWVMSMPMLAGKHGYGKSWSALARAYRDLGPLIKDGAFTKGDYDALPADVRAIVKDLAARGRIEITLEHDLGQWNSNVDDKAYNRAFTWVTKGLRSVNSRLEMLNRLATGIAAARLEGVGNAKNATDYADRVIIGTHGDYNAFNAPRLMRTPLGRMATQFRKFQLIQITMYTKLVSDALKGASPTERAVARRVLAYNLGHMAVLGGAMGLPGFQLFSMVLGSIFGDDDEPDDAEATLRRIMGNGPLTDALTRGVPNAFGVDLSGKVGSGNMLSLFPYADWDIESRSGYQNLLAAAAGPFVGGLMPKWADAVGNAKQGDYYKALEKVLPGALGNAIKGTRFAVDGVTTTRGVQAMSADEITWVDGLFQAVGLPTSTITDRNFRSGAEYKASKFFDEKASQVKKDYIEAFQDNDTDAMAEARQEWLDMQATRKRLGLTVQPLSQLIKAPQERRKRERAAVGGVATDRETQGFVRQFTE